MVERIRRGTSFSNVVALMALFIALGGGAYATVTKNSVKSQHIVNGQVKSQDIKNDSLKGKDIDESSLDLPAGPQGPQGPQGDPGADGAPGAGQTFFDSVSTEESTTSDTPGDLATVGPEITVTTTDQTYLRPALQATIKSEPNDFPGTIRSCKARLVSSTAETATPEVSGANFTAAFQTQFKQETFVVAPGTHTFTVKYFGDPAGTTCTFKDRKVWMTVIEPSAAP